MKKVSLIVISFFLLITVLCWSSGITPVFADAVDAVVATVDEQPILLSDLNKLLSKKITMTEAAASSEAQKALDRLIFESLVNSEAESRRVTVADSDIERYVDEVATRNSLSRADFVDALKAQGKDWATYKAQVRTDILQTRLASIMLQGMSTVKDSELKSYFEEHPELLQKGASITLRRLVTSSSEIAKSFANREFSADDFIALVKKASISPDAADGGMLGAVSERDLAPEIFSALMHTQIGSTSEVVAGANQGGFTVYYVAARSTGSPEDIKALRERVKRELTQAKLAQQMEGMFQTELYKNHTIDKKI